ncbi:hypothetical protein Pelo_17947 [Pelomyxa schiedti]|nr:hypothetical protein Pelo_17947 [Pelomyxa schiedti]
MPRTTWNITNIALGGVTSTATVTTRGQLVALAVGATVARCGGGSTLQQIMGRDHAATFARLLWSDWVRPTIRLFVLDVSGSVRGDASESSESITLTFSVSPLLLSVASGPALAPFMMIQGTLVDACRVVDKELLDDDDDDDLGAAVVVRRLGSGRRAHVMKCSHRAVQEFAFNAKWAAMATYPPHDSRKRAATLAVASLQGVPGDCDGDGDLEAFRRAVVVDLPFVCLVGSCLIRVSPDKSVDSEVVVTHTTGNRANMYVVDMEQTYNSRRLVLLSTTTWELPSGYGLLSLLVLRNWNSPGGHGSRTFIVNLRKRWSPPAYEVFLVEESTATSRCLNLHNDNVGYVCRLQGRTVNVYHRDNVALPLKPNCQWGITPRSESHLKDVDTLQVRAEGGFIFKVSTSSSVEVIEPTSGHVVLTISFPGLTSIWTAPCSFFL